VLVVRRRTKVESFGQLEVRVDDEDEPGARGVGQITHPLDFRSRHAAPRQRQ